MRLEEDAEAAARVGLARGGDRRRDLARVVGVVVDDRHPGDLRDLEAPAGAGEAPERRSRLVGGDAGELERGERRARVLPVVLARQAERPLERRRVRDRARCRPGPAVERSLELGERAELAVVVELDVRHHRDLGREREDGAVGLVALDDEPALPRARVAAELRHRRADQPGGVAAGLGESEGDHRRGRPLSVRAADDDRAAQRDELGEELRAPAAGHGRVGGGDDGLPARAYDRLGSDLDVDPGERVEVRRPDAVPAADLGAPGPRELGVGRETRAADADEPEPAPLKGGQARSAPRRSPRPRRASRPAASPRPSARAAAGRRAASGRGRARRRARGRGSSSPRPP